MLTPHAFTASVWLPLRCSKCMGFRDAPLHRQVPEAPTQPHIFSPRHTLSHTDLVFLSIIEAGVTYEQYTEEDGV